jgi:hypothetical protein
MENDMCKFDKSIASMASPDFPEIWDVATDAVRNKNRGYRGYRRVLGSCEIVYPDHAGWILLSEDFKLHPVVRSIVYQYKVRPLDWQLLLLEWPHVSIEDDSKLAYSRNRAAMQDYIENKSARQTRTSVGKYIARHWPHVPDHIRRDWVGAFSPSEFAIWEGTENIIAAIELGPRSCMKSTYGSIPFDSHDREKLLSYRAGTAGQDAVNWESHPYAVYQPQYGWSMAVRLDRTKPADEVVQGRALINGKKWVRSYKRGDDESDYSHTDEKLEHWLKQQGYEKVYEWAGCMTARLDHPRSDGLMMPYLDGSVQRAIDNGSHMTVDERGCHVCDNTDASTTAQDEDEEEYVGNCVRCGGSVYESDGDRLWAGIDEDACVCGSCADRYTSVTGVNRRGDEGEYYIPNNDAVTVDGTDYDGARLPEYICQLDDGSYAHEDDCVYCVDEVHRLVNDCVEDSDEDYHEKGSDDIVQVGLTYYKLDSDEIVQPVDDEDEWHVKDDCWQAPNGDWFTEEQPQIEIEIEIESTYTT